jgi:hypothetical protein
MVGHPKFNPMARCDEGYRCEVCGGDVEAIADSDLYLRYVLGEVPIFRLQKLAERHVRCNPAVAQFIVDTAFPSVDCLGDFDKRTMDASYVAAEEKRVTRAWRRLQILPGLGLPLEQYPLNAETMAE